MSKTRVAAPTLGSSDPVATDSAVPYITARTIGSVPKRRKPLPPDAHTERVPGFKLYQLPDNAEFRCTKCRRDRISDDSLAVDETAGVIMCARCYGREVRPRLYKPTRLVPFPSLLSWLNYEPQAVRTEVPADVGQRTAAAAMPSGHRVNVEMIGPSSVAELPRTPMNAQGNELDAGTRLQIEANPAASAAARAALERRDVHPCVRVFGACAHGSVCFFRNAPYNLSLSFLMGLRDESPTEECTPVFNLPDSRAPARGTAAFDAWVAAKRASANQAEWQLWNQPGAMALVDTVIPPPTAAEVEDAAAEDDGGDDDALKTARGNMAKAARSLGLTERKMGLRVQKHNIDARRYRVHGS